MGKDKSIAASYARQFAEVEGALPGRGLAWLDALRANAIERFAELDFPTPKLESWKFTNLRPLTREVFAPSPATRNGLGKGDVARWLADDLPCHLVVFVDGHFRADLSELGALPRGARVTSLAETLAGDPAWLEPRLAGVGAIEGDAPVALNTALMADGAVIALDRGVALEKPVHLLYLATAATKPVAMHLRNLVVAEPGSSATLIETYAAPRGGRYWTNAVTDIVVARDAQIRHFKLQNESVDAFHLAATRARLAKGSGYDSFYASFGARLSRNEIATRLDGEGADCRLSGVYLARGRQHVDNTTVIDHREPGSVSKEHYKGVLDGDAHGVFQGKIIVRPGAQKTDAHQLNKNLLLSKTAQADTKPELEIHADDVKCSHGAAVGELDAEALFYLRSRGLDPAHAQRMLVEAFIGEVIDGIGTPALRSHLGRLVAAWLSEAED